MPDWCARVACCHVHVGESGVCVAKLPAAAAAATAAATGDATALKAEADEGDEGAPAAPAAAEAEAKDDAEPWLNRPPEPKSGDGGQDDAAEEGSDEDQAEV